MAQYYRAEKEYVFHKRVCNAVGMGVSAIMFFTPLLKRQNYLMRLALAGGIGYAFYSHLRAVGEDMHEVAVDNWYKNYIIENGFNYKVYD